MNTPSAASTLRWLKQASVAAAVGAIGLAGNEVQAATYYWNSTGTSTWTTATSWSTAATGIGATGAGPTSTSDAAVFNGSSFNGNTVAQLAGNQSVGTLTFNNTGSTVLESSSSTARTLTSGGNITIAAGAGAVTIGDATNVVNLALNATEGWANNSSNIFTVANTISGNAAVHLSGTGGFNLAGANTFSGASTTIAGVTYMESVAVAANVLVQVGTSTSLGTGVVDLRGTLQATAPLTGANKIMNTIVIGTGTATIGGSNNIELGGAFIEGNNSAAKLAVTNTGATTLSGTVSLSDLATVGRGLTVDVAGTAGSVTISGTIQNFTTAGSGMAGALTKTDTGTLVLSGANTYTGATTVGGGTLEFANAASLYNGTTPTAANLTTASGAMTVFNVGTGGFTAAQVNSLNTALVTNATATTGFKSGSTIGLDTTGQDFTYSTAITNGASGGTNVLGLAKVGSNALILSGNNTYTGGTTVSAGTLYANNTAGSGTGSGAVTVTGGKLAGSGTITAGTTSATGVTVKNGGSLASGDAQSSISGHVDGTHLTVNNTLVTVGSSFGAGTGSANLTFDLGAGNSGLSGGTAGYLTYGNPNNNTTYLSLTGSSSINFAGTTSISLVDLTNLNGAGTGTLALRLVTPYLLIHAGSNADYSNLVVNVGTLASPIYTLSQNDAALNGYVVGVYTGGLSNPTSAQIAGNISTISISEFGSDGVTPLVPGSAAEYPSPYLYLDAGNLEVVPEPATWAMMIGGLALLIVIQRRRKI